MDTYFAAKDPPKYKSTSTIEINVCLMNHQIFVNIYNIADMTSPITKIHIAQFSIQSTFLVIDCKIF